MLAGVSGYFANFSGEMLFRHSIPGYLNSYFNMASRNGARKSEEENLLSENDRMLEGLAGKVSRLKAIAVDIKHDTDNQNQYLDGMDDQFGSAGGLLKGSAQRLSQVVKSAGSDRKCMCYMILGLVTAFFILYYGLAWIKT